MFSGSLICRKLNSLLALSSLLSVGAWLSPPAAAQDSADPLVTFDYRFPGADPEHYLITLGGGRQATYDSEGTGSQRVEGNAYHVQFTLSAPTWDRIRQLAEKAGYFAGEVDSNKKGLALTGIKTLTYRDAHNNNRAVYNYSRIPAVQQLTALFEGVSVSLESGRKLEYDYRYQKLALDEELKQVEAAIETHELLEASVLEPILKRIANDPTVLNVARARALRLLESAGN
jgi:hypothetical protein